MIFLDARCRYLIDALAAYARVIIADPLQAERFRDDPRRLYYADPADASCYVSSGREYQGVTPETVLRRYFDVVTPAGRDAVVALGGQRYVMKTVAPWSMTDLVRALPEDSEGLQVAWFDFQTATQAVKKVSLLDEQGGVIGTWDLGPAVSLQPFYFDPGDKGKVLYIESERAMPARVVLGIEEARHPRVHDLAQARNLSLVHWFKPPFVTAGPRHKYGVALETGGVLEIPAIPGADNLPLTIHLAFKPDRRQKNIVRLIYKEEGLEIARGAVDLSRSLIRHRVHLPLRSEQGLRRVEMYVEPVLSTDAFLKVTSFGIAIGL
ncbi:MAG: hypothetical protein KJ726_06125 [Verrucomicrobia bacterium]|nr:hypothetical protein [Verrucomicrobiota bacterium]MBU1909602.1 hypothetical protein [Verrucomicrobiota bacterium]